MDLSSEFLRSGHRRAPFLRATTDDSSNDAADDADDADDWGTDVRHFIIAVDFGTTYSSISVLCQRQRTEIIDPDDIQSIGRYPCALAQGSQEGPKEVPTESWYPRYARDMPLRQPLERLAIDGDDGNASNAESTDENDAAMLDANSSDPCDNGDDSDITANDDGQAAFNQMDEDNQKIVRFYWGYCVSKQLGDPDTYPEQSRRILRSKLLLDRSLHTKHIRQQLAVKVREIRRAHLIRDETDVIADYLASLLQHTRKQIEIDYRYNDACPVEFVLSLPPMWTEKSKRTMQNAMTRALRKSRFIPESSYDINNLFIVSEPEAAATYALAKSNDIMPNDCFVLLDAGGGTVDAVTYKVRTVRPLRLEREEVAPAGALCGSSFLNEACERLLLDRLKSETYLEHDGMTIGGQVTSLLREFELYVKRAVDIYSKDLEGQRFFVGGLRPNTEKRFKQNRLHLLQDDLKSIFEPCLDGVSRLLLEQLNQAKSKGIDVTKVILMGGFANSPSVFTRLKNELDVYRRGGIPLIRAKLPECAVAHGAVLRSLNKDDGPERRLGSSYGVLRTEPYQPEVLHAHKRKTPWTDPLDGNKYIKNTIDWIMCKDDILPYATGHLIRVSHTFPDDPNESLICRELFFVSDKSHESHYRRWHRKNNGATEEGQVIVDMSDLRHDPSVKRVIPELGERGQPHYLVEFDLVVLVNGRNLRFVAYPKGRRDVIKGERQISIAAAFQPGTN